MLKPARTEKPLGYECRFATYVPPPDGDNTDLHVVKEIVHYADGTAEPHLRLITNFKRPFYITKKGCRVHNDRKEWEDLDKLDRFECTQTNLHASIAKALGTPWVSDPRKLMRSPYIYGSDILSTAVIKQSYQDKWPDLRTPYTVAVFDTEKDVVQGTNEINMATLSMKKRVFTAVKRSHVEGVADVEARCHEALRKYLGSMEKRKDDDTIELVDYLKDRGIEWELIFVDTEIEVVAECMKRAHAWQPDFVAVWNLDYDVGVMIKACEKAGVNPADIFSDPSIPKAYRYFRYKQGPRTSKSASGVVKAKKPSDQWHTVFAPASFYFIDAMCVYRILRIAKGEEPSYALDDILDKALGIRKLKFKEAEGMVKIDWHVFMQSNYPIEYIIYNVFDCISMEVLDEKTIDLAIAVPMYAGCSDFVNFHSQPRRAADALHYFSLKKGRAFGSTSDRMATEIDEETLPAKGWIVTLPANLVSHNGIACIEEWPGWRTNIRIHVADLDVEGSYPNGGAVFNMSKQTTFRELCRIEDIPEIVQRMQGINYATSGHTNAVEVACALFKLPDMSEMLTAFEAHLAKEEAQTVSI